MWELENKNKQCLDTSEIPSIIREFFENQYSNKLKNWKKQVNFCVHMIYENRGKSIYISCKQTSATHLKITSHFFLLFQGQLKTYSENKNLGRYLPEFSLVFPVVSQT
jgi:hypothetical protein